MMSTTKPQFVWMNGEFVEWERAKVPILTHALHYGTAVFEGIRAYKTDGGLCVFRLIEHMRRLKTSAHAYVIDLPYSENDLCQATTALLAKNEIHDPAYIRPIAFKAEGVLKLDYRKVPTWVAIAAFPYDKYFEKEGLDVCVSSWRKTCEPSVVSLAKASGHYINAVLGKVEAAQNGFDEAVFLDHRGFVSEGSGQNIFIVKDETVLTPPLYAGILGGITRDSVCTILRDRELTLQERDIARGELYACEEAFFTGTAAEISPIISIDRRKIGEGRPGPLTRLLQKLYFEAVSGKDKRYEHWLTPVYPRTPTKAAAAAPAAVSPHKTDWTRLQGP